MKSDNPKQYWDIINKKDRNKNNPISIDELVNHFEGLNQVNGDTSPNNFDPRTVDHSINSFINEEITMDEVLIARGKLKSNKACDGIDNVINEFIKHCPDSVIKIMCKLFNLVLNTGIVPTEWNVGIIIPLYKNKGATNDPNNYRGITLLSSIGKLFTSIINTRLTNYIDNTGLLGEDQAGFRSGYSTRDG